MSPLRGRKTFYLIFIITEEQIDNVGRVIMLGRGYSAAQDLVSRMINYQVTVEHGNEKIL